MYNITNESVDDKLKNRINKLKKRQKLKFSIKDYFQIILRKIKTQADSTNEIINIYEKGEEIIKNVFDLQNVFRELVDLKFMKNIMFTDYQRYILRLLKLNLENDHFYNSKNYSENELNYEKYLSDFLSASELDTNRKIIDLINNSIKSL